MLICSLSHLKQNLNDEHNYFDNEAKNNFALILEYLNNEYTYEDDYYYINNNQFIYKYSFVRLKNNTIYYFPFTETLTIKQRFDSFHEENLHIKVHIINRNKYEQILYYFSNKIKFITKKYPLCYHIKHICLFYTVEIFVNNFVQQNVNI